MKVYLIRHGNFFPENEDDGSLTEKGIILALRLAERFINEGICFKKVYSSSKKRARETAKICCEIMGIESLVLSDSLIEERSDENEEEVKKRMRWFIDGIRQEIGHDSCGVLSHYYAIRYLLKSLFVPDDKTRLPHTGVTLLDYTDLEPIWLDYNPSLHLEGIESY